MKRQQLAKRLEHIEQTLNDIEKTTLRPPNRSTHTIKFIAPPDDKATYEVQFSEIPRAQTKGVQRFDSLTKIKIIIQPAKVNNLQENGQMRKNILKEQNRTAVKKNGREIADQQEREKRLNERNIMETPPSKNTQRQFQYPFNSNLNDIAVTPPHPVNRLNKEYPYLQATQQTKVSERKDQKHSLFEPFRDLQRQEVKNHMVSSFINPSNPQNRSTRIKTQHAPKKNSSKLNNMDKSKTSRNLSTKALEVGQRLSHHSKPCNHNDYILIEADHRIFSDILCSSTFFTKYFSDRKFVSDEQQKRLFNGLRNSGLPYCEWNNAIKNFIYRKMQHLPTKNNLPKYKLRL